MLLGPIPGRESPHRAWHGWSEWEPPTWYSKVFQSEGGSWPRLFGGFLLVPEVFEGSSMVFPVLVYTSIHHDYMK